MAISPQIPDSAFGHALNLWTPAHPVLLQRLLNKHGNFEKAYRATAEKTKYIDVGGEFTKLEKLGIKLLSSQDKNYPKLLGAVPDSPALLYYRGSMDVTDELSLAVVGTRRASDYGRQATPRLVRPIAECGVTIVSGLAYGIDSFAHEATLECSRKPSVIIYHLTLEMVLVISTFVRFSKYAEK